MKGNFVVSDELTVTVPGLGLQPGSGHSCAVELSSAGCTVVHHPRQFGPVTKKHHPRVHCQRQFGQMTERHRPQSPYSDSWPVLRGRSTIVKERVRWPLFGFQNLRRQ